MDRYVSGQFHDDSRITLGVQFMVKRLTIDGNPIDLQVWDFGGEDRFRFILPAYCRGAHGAIFMYDITNPASLYHMDDWMLVLRSQNGTFPVLAAATKADLGYARKVGVAEAVKITEKYGIFEVMEVSSKTGLHVNELFETICQAMINASHLTPAIPKRPIASVASKTPLNVPKRTTLTPLPSAPASAQQSVAVATIKVPQKAPAIESPKACVSEPRTPNL